MRDIARATDERTIIAAIRPFAPALNSLGNLFCRSGEDALFLCGCLNAFPADYVGRQKVGGTHVSPFILLQMAVVPAARVDQVAHWSGPTSSKKWIAARVFELTYTAWDLEPFARDVGHDGPPFRWDPARRPLLRCELDAAFFHLYGLSRDDTDYVMDTFPIVRKHDEKAHGEYRTKRVILEIYDEMAAAARTGKPYETRLDPPPADPRVAHPESTRPAWAKKGAR